jgi:hypothetical protein
MCIEFIFVVVALRYFETLSGLITLDRIEHMPPTYITILHDFSRIIRVRFCLKNLSQDDFEKYYVFEPKDEPTAACNFNIFKKKKRKKY